MAERKVLNKYYPPDYDPSKLRSFEKKSVRKMCNVRMMLPMTVHCYTCQQYMYIGTKFNMKVETVQDEDYLGIKIYRFYFKCTNCYSEITFKTDPKNNDYVAERGASRNHEPWKDMLMAEEAYKEMKKQEMKEDAMKSLEHRTYDSKREMDILDAMDQVRTLNRRECNVDYDELIRKVVKEEDKVKEEMKAERERIELLFKERDKKLLEGEGDKDEEGNDHDKGDLIEKALRCDSELFLLNKKIKRDEEVNGIDNQESNKESLDKALNGNIQNNSGNSHNDNTVKDKDIEEKKSIKQIEKEDKDNKYNNVFKKPMIYKMKLKKSSNT